MISQLLLNHIISYSFHIHFMYLRYSHYFQIQVLTVLIRLKIYDHFGKYSAQQTRQIYLMFDQCWTNVVDGGPALVKHWVDVSCLLGGVISTASTNDTNDLLNCIIK